MGCKLPTLPRSPFPEKRYECAERFCKVLITIRESPWFPYCSLDCKDWDEQIKENKEENN